MKTIFYAILFLFIIGLSNHTEVRAQTNQTQNQSALLYKISGNGLKNPSYLFGTTHLICRKDMIPMEKFEAYLKQSDQIIMELDFDNPSEMQAMAGLTGLPAGKSLTDYLDEKQIKKIDEMTKEILKVPFDRLKNFHPLIFSTLLLRTPKAVGCAAPVSYEASFMQSAASKKKPIEGLETVAMQVKVINSTPLKKQAEGLYTLALNPDPFMASFRNLLETYKTQNIDKIYEVMQTQLANEPGFQTALLDDRNTKWIPKLEKAFKEKTSFIAVGAGHLGGKLGVVRLLRAKGYTLTPIKL